ncbi:MAG: regulatory protein RecX [Atopobiaceae bacterium]|nr:regulatory protein RecX [Atopobiaceae bacterium]
MASTSASRQGALAWEVILPGKRAAQSWGAKPRGTIVIGADEVEQERISVPKQVATILNAKKKADEVHPASRAELLYVVGELSRSCARARIERLINTREYSSKEVADKLAQDGYSKRVAEECINRACEAGLISDARFADSFIRSKVYAGWGMTRIVKELARRGIEASELAGWPYDYLDPEDEYTRAIELAQSKHVYGNNAYQKLVRYLCGRGFSLGVATRAAKQVLSDDE